MGGVAQARLRNLVTGSLLEQNFRADLKLEEVSIEKHSMGVENLKYVERVKLTGAKFSLAFLAINGSPQRR